ncbi:MAG: helix-turn-helix domain-containing protein [Bacteroidia bacterium]|nr:helix-turn-helix domain-containing protein [Bacteroidia bacterium]
MIENAFKNIVPYELALFCDFIPDVQFWIKDENSVFKWVNASLLENYALQDVYEVIGKSDFDLSPFYIAEQFVLDDKAVLNGKIVESRIELVSSMDTTINWCYTTKRPIKDSNGRIIGTMGISRKLDNQSNPEIPIYRLNDIVRYIHTNIHKPVSISKMAEIMNCSISTLERTFRKLLQDSPMGFTRKIKMQYACKALINSESSISDIAYSLGYADESHFIREFNRLIKNTPLKYRKQYLSKKGMVKYDEK